MNSEKRIFLPGNIFLIFFLPLFDLKCYVLTPKEPFPFTAHSSPRPPRSMLFSFPQGRFFPKATMSAHFPFE
ncbi:MAG: hypothetical protein A2162_00670 [Deltaproteobacteria bacterium RBG_13_52_11b]|nr:MAG: hypothetical protein A2162_00670 [Deltaproteobacteria bacterium RBG_13_52_11b]